MVEKQIQQQTDEHVRALDPLEHVRLRPGMYVGGVDVQALHHLAYEVVDNAIDEALAGRCDHIMVTLHDENTVSVRDNGGGIPVGMNKDKNRPTLEVVMTVIGAGGKFGTGAYKVSGGLHGVGVSAVNALSERMKTTVYREGYVWEQEYVQGRPVYDMRQARPMEPDEPTGTVQTFKPDFTILDQNDFNFETMAHRFREMAFVTRRVTITLRDERVKPLPQEVTFYFEGGLKSFVRYMNRHRTPLHEAIGLEREMEVEGNGDTKKAYSVGVEVALQYTDSSNVTEIAFANTIHTPDGGTHLTGLRSAITSVINRYARKISLLKEKDSNFSGTDVLEGMTAIVSVKHPNPSFESQTKVKLLNPDVQGLVSQAVTEALTEFLDLNPKEGRRIVEKCMTSMRAREAAKKARDLVRSGPSLLESSTLPGKLADCSRHGANSEIYIVEGDSAGGCFAGDTLVALVDGRHISFAQLVEEQAAGQTHFGYTIRHDGTVGVERLIHARVTKHDAEVIRLTLDNGETLVCTPDHRFMLRDGSYKAAIDLTTDDALMPLFEPTAMQSIQTVTLGNREMVAEAVLTADMPFIAVSQIERLQERIDVYDVEVSETHNFALASGVFVHNSAKQGRDRHFQAILPLRGKILNTERARLDKMLDNNEIKALISALGTGIHEDFTIEKIRYDRVIIMSVAGDEPTLVRNKQSAEVRFVKIGAFIDECLAGIHRADDYEVMCFDINTHETHFSPLKAVIRHPHHEAMYKITTLYNRSVKVTSSHSVFVYEDGAVKLKKGNEVRVGDIIVAPRRIPRSEAASAHVDLLTTFYNADLADSLYVQGAAVTRIAKARVLAKMSHPHLWAEPHVQLNLDSWRMLMRHRELSDLSQKQVAHAIGVKQPITISQWERGIHRPVQSKFEAYLNTIGWEAPLPIVLAPSRLDDLRQGQDNSGNVRWREISDYKPLVDFTADELTLLDRDVQLVPQAHVEKAFDRYLPINHDLMWFLGWYVAEGTLSAHQVSLNIGAKDKRFIPQLSDAIQRLFNETPRCYHDPDSDGIKLYFHSVMAARLLQAWGVARVAHEKILPEIVFSVSEDLQRTFLEGYFLGDGATSGQNVSFTTNSPLLKDGLLYLLGQLGLVATHTMFAPGENALVQTRHPYYTITICGKEQLEVCHFLWQQHSNAAKVQAYIDKPIRQKQNFISISDDLIGLEVLEAQEVDLVGDYVYDFSVEGDENFICGTGGLCAHNTDADTDGSHIRTLLLTFFYRHMQAIVTQGHLYIAQPPIYLLKQGKDQRYIYPTAGMSESQLLEKALRDYKDPSKVGVQRYKGLGEMNPEQLWETTMNPEHRALLKVTVDDAAESDSLFDMLMGSSVPPRRRFIQTNAKLVKNLDI